MIPNAFLTRRPFWSLFLRDCPSEDPRNYGGAGYNIDRWARLAGVLHESGGSLTRASVLFVGYAMYRLGWIFREPARNLITSVIESNTRVYVWLQRHDRMRERNRPESSTSDFNRTSICPWYTSSTSSCSVSTMTPLLQSGPMATLARPHPEPR